MVKFSILKICTLIIKIINYDLQKLQIVVFMTILLINNNNINICIIKKKEIIN